MADEEKREEAESADKDEAEDLIRRFPVAPEVPETPRLTPTLPPHPARPKPGTIEPGSYNKMAVAATAASSFIMPIIVLSVLGYWLDGKWHTAPWLAFTGVLVGLVVGVTALMRVVQRLSD